MRFYIDSINFDLNSSKIIVFNVPKRVLKGLNLNSNGSYLQQFSTALNNIFKNYYTACDFDYTLYTSIQKDLKRALEVYDPPFERRYILITTEKEDDNDADYVLQKSDCFFDIESLSSGTFHSGSTLNSVQLKLIKGNCTRKTQEYMLARCSQSRRILLKNGNLVHDGPNYDFIHACTLNLHKYYDVSKMTINKSKDFFEYEDTKIGPPNGFNDRTNGF